MDCRSSVTLLLQLQKRLADPERRYSELVERNDEAQRMPGKSKSNAQTVKNTGRQPEISQSEE